MRAPSLPGLHLFSGFLSSTASSTAIAAAIRLSQQAHLEAQSSASPATLSPAHNVNSQERYQSVAVTTESGASAICEHFADYAEGHRLTYFRGTLPEVGVPLVRLSSLAAVRAEVASSRARLGRPADDRYKWKLTLNHYPTSPTSIDRPRRVGFPWHRDLHANGAATMILNLGEAGVLQFGEEPAGADPADGLRYSSDHTATAEATVAPLEEVRLTDGDLLVLTGRARWDYLHRVLPSDAEGASRGERVSLVWGVW